MATSQDIVNEALALIGYSGQPVTGFAPNFDSSVPGKIAQRVYALAVAGVARLNAWSFPRMIATLVPTGNTAPFPWLYEYGFPGTCIDVWQVAPHSLNDINNPTPVTWERGVATLNSIEISVIWTNQANAIAIFNGNPVEAAWDPLFSETVARYLAAAFAVANLGKPDLAKLYSDQWPQLAQIASERTDQ